MLITGKSERYSRELLRQIKTQLKKEKHQLVSLSEFCKYVDLSIDEVEALIK